MFAKVIILFCFHDFLIKTVASQQPTDTPICHLTQKQFSEFKGPDLCGKMAGDIDSYKKICNKVAIHEKIITSGSLHFKENHPKCWLANVQTYDSKKQPSKVITTIVVFCASVEASFAIGKGQSPKGVVNYECTNAQCEATFDIPNMV